LLLLGPTGSGKTPLGRLIEKRGLWGRRFVHFDFGAQLRAVVEGSRFSHSGEAAQAAPDSAGSSGLARGAQRPLFAPREIAFFEDVLQRGALLEDEHFHLAARLLHAFLDQRRANQQTWVVLNGLPRHVGQARDLEAHLQVRMVVVLECSAETVLERIRRNVAGDRTGRPDDEPQLVAQKLAVYQRRTAPLLTSGRGTEQHGGRDVGGAVGPSTLAGGLLKSGKPKAESRAVNDQ